MYVLMLVFGETLVFHQQSMPLTIIIKQSHMFSHFLVACAIQGLLNTHIHFSNVHFLPL